MDTNSSTNITSIANDTAAIDVFCTDLLMGPLVWTIFSVPCACVGVPASVWLLWVLFQRQRSGSSNDIYMVNLTIVDLICNISKIPTVLNYSIWRNKAYFDICSFLEGFNFNGRPLLMACNCVDCYMAVVRPISYMKMKNSRYRLVVCALVWATTLSYNLYGLNRDLIHVSIRALSRLLTIFTIAFCDISILRALKRPGPAGRSDTHPLKQRALQAITNSFIMTSVSYLPQVLVSLLSPLLPLSTREAWCNVIMPSLLSTVLSTTLLPVLHLRNLGSLKHFGRPGCVRCV